MDSPLNQDWLDEVAQRRLSADEAAQWRRQLSERPLEARRLEEELALNHLLDSQPKPRVSTNFTARVLSDIQESPQQESRISKWWAEGIAEFGTGFVFRHSPSNLGALDPYCCRLGLRGDSPQLGLATGSGPQTWYDGPNGCRVVGRRRDAGGGCPAGF